MTLWSYSKHWITDSSINEAFTLEYDWIGPVYRTLRCIRKLFQPCRVLLYPTLSFLLLNLHPNAYRNANDNRHYKEPYYFSSSPN